MHCIFIDGMLVLVEWQIKINEKDIGFWKKRKCVYIYTLIYNILASNNTQSKGQEKHVWLTWSISLKLNFLYEKRLDSDNIDE